MLSALFLALPKLPADGEQAMVRIPTGSSYQIAQSTAYRSSSQRPYDLSQSIPPSMWKEWQESTYGRNGQPSTGSFIVNAVVNSGADRILGDGSRLMVRDTSRDLWLRWLVSLPPTYKDGSRWPLLIHLHGVGERGVDLNELRHRGPFARKEDKLPFIVLAPQCPFGTTWQTEDLQIFLKESLKKYRVDTSRIFISGHGMGASAAWQLAGAEPRRFNAIVAPGVEPLPQDRARLKRLRRYEGTESDPWVENGVVEFLKK
ncbi:hypothetical protein EON81_00445 [bacterium]|nr:MAG: hypothetical protein EON81_00445 [bacterium]